MREHRRTLRVYLEDTDAQGVVYHTNYLKYCERGRTDILMQEGFRLTELQEQGWTLVVHEMHVKYRRPARLHDELTILTTAERTSDYRIAFHHQVLAAEDPKPLVTAEVHVVAVSTEGGVVPLPADVLST